MNNRDYTSATKDQLYAIERDILLKPEEWKQLTKITKGVDQELNNV